MDKVSTLFDNIVNHTLPVRLVRVHIYESLDISDMFLYWFRSFCEEILDNMLAE